MISILFFIFLWVLMAIGFGGIMVYYAQAEIYCSQLTTLEQTAANATEIDCFPYVDAGMLIYGRFVYSGTSPF